MNNKISSSSSKAKTPIILIHGGAGNADRDKSVLEKKQALLDSLASAIFSELCQGLSAVDAVDRAVYALEDSGIFNAGKGATLQQDGLARLTSSLMDGSTECFTAVALASHLEHPSLLARALQGKSRNRVLGPLGAQLLARELGIPLQLAPSSSQIDAWHRQLQVFDPKRTGTVGAVALALDGKLAAATSTGGTGPDFPERMSDVSTVAGNFASAYAAVSCSGVGEQIVDSALAARLEARIRDGMPLSTALLKLQEETSLAKREYGCIVLSNEAEFGSFFSTEQFLIAAKAA